MIQEKKISSTHQPSEHWIDEMRRLCFLDDQHMVADDRQVFSKYVVFYCVLL